jgi:putative salt-induced outer membrane protein
MNYRWEFNASASFTQDLAVESGEVNTYIESVSAIKTQLFSELALVASYTVKNNSDVPPDAVRTDTYTALSIEYAF